MNILMISPESPPKNAPESIQVGRYLEELNKNNNIVLINTPSYGWTKDDNSLEKKLSNTKIITMKLPFHKLLYRIFVSKYFNFLHFPDTNKWLKFKIKTILKLIKKNNSEIIYSRSMPVTSALIALEIKNKTDLPWVMHISDPWADSPYINYKSEKQSVKFNEIEKLCFNKADMIMFTTKSMANFYSEKYPEYEKKIAISSNVMDNNKETIIKHKQNKIITFTYTGAFYGKRNPYLVLEAVKEIIKDFPKYKNTFQFLFYGNMNEELKKTINNLDLNEVKIMGHLPYNEITKVQREADVLLTIEPEGKNPLFKTFMPSKILDYLSLRKKILAITPENSETWKLIKKGYGWSVSPTDKIKLVEIIISIINDVEQLHNENSSYGNLEEFTAKYNVKILEDHMLKLIHNSKKVKDV